MKDSFGKTLLCVMLATTFVLLTGCSNVDKNIEASTTEAVSVQSSPEDKIVSEIINELKDYGLPIIYSIIYNEENDPNGRENVTYLAKGNFSDSDIESNYDEKMPLSGTVEVFEDKASAIMRATQLEECKVDDFASRIIVDNVLVRLNAKYSEKQVNDIATAIKGTVHSIDFDRLEESNPFDIYPLVTYDEAVSGDYTESTVCIDAIADNVVVHKSNNDEFDYAKLHLWVETNGNYICESNINIMDSDLKKHQYLEEIKNVKDGDLVRVVVNVSKNNEVSIYRFEAIKIVGNEDLKHIYSTVTSKTDIIDYKAVERNPENYLYKYAVVKGKIMQIIDESDTSCEYLIKTKDGIVYVTLMTTAESRDYRLLENDEVIAYGQLLELYEYSSLTKENKVPNLNSPLILLNN